MPVMLSAAIVIDDVRMRAKLWRDAEIEALQQDHRSVAERARAKAVVLEQLANDLQEQAAQLETV